MPHLPPPTLTRDEQVAVLRATAGHPRDHLIVSMALGTGPRPAELVGLNGGDVFAPDGTRWFRSRVRREIAKRGRAAGAFLPDRLVVHLGGRSGSGSASAARTDPLRPRSFAINQAKAS